MELTITPYTPGAKEEPFMPDNGIYKELKEDGIRNMINAFYNLLTKSDIKHLFPDNDKELELAKQRAADFIIQRFGGPNYYEQRRGKPLLVKRHAPFTITPSGRITWLTCYREALLKQKISPKTLQEYWLFIDQFSKWMVNSERISATFNIK